jgi:hypothetical protein
MQVLKRKIRDCMSFVLNHRENALNQRENALNHLKNSLNHLEKWLKLLGIKDGKCRKL